MDEEQNEIADQVNGGDEDVRTGAIDPGFVDEAEANATEQEHSDQDDPYGVKKRLGMQAKKHQREMRQMQEHMMRIQAQLGGDSATPHNLSYANSYPSPGQPNSPGMSEEEKIQHAVRYALGAKDHEERQAKDAERQAHVHKKYQRMNEDFDKASEKYEDFDDVVRESDAPFTDHVRDALLLVKNPADVAYKLGKNRSELERISKLHPIDQAQEVIDLSHALRSASNGKSASTSNKVNPLGSIRQNPAHSSGAITDKTPPSTIRARMKAGTWK
jgi:hypothetical protein